MRTNKSNIDVFVPGDNYITDEAKLVGFAWIFDCKQSKLK